MNGDMNVPITEKLIRVVAHRLADESCMFCYAMGIIEFTGGFNNVMSTATGERILA